MSAVADDPRVELVRGLNTLAPPEAQTALAAARRYAHTWRPRTDEELWQAIRDLCGIAIPRAAVCPGHAAPFDVVADCFFQRGQASKLVISSRGSGKTKNVAALHALQARVHPGYYGTTAGAKESQAVLLHRYVGEVIRRPGWAHLIEPRDIHFRHTAFRNESVLEVVVGSISGVNAPHPHRAHLDEIELLRPGVYEEALNMAQGGNGLRGETILTSSWKYPHGLVSEIKEACERARRLGHPPAHDVYTSCVFEVSERCPHDCSACPFAGVVKGTWEDGTPRSFESVCKRGSPDGQGKLKRAGGFIPLEDTLRRFRDLSRRTWEAQQESHRPTAEGLVYDCFDEARHSVSWWEPADEDGEPYGPIFAGADFGGTAPFAIGLLQHLAVDVELDGRRLPEGSFVLFDEVYVANIGAVEAGRRLNERIDSWASAWPEFHVERIWRDPAAKAAALDWRRLGDYGPASDGYRAIPTRARGGQRVEDGIGVVYELIDSDRFYVDVMRCPNFLREVGAYEKDPLTGRPVKEMDHLQDAVRYGVAGELWRGEPAPPPPALGAGEPTMQRVTGPQDAEVGEAPPIRAAPRRAMAWATPRRERMRF